MRIRTTVSTLVVVALVTVLAACGSDEPTATTSTTSSTSTSAPTSTTTTSTTTSSTTTTTEAPQQVVLVHFGEGDGSDCGQVGSYERVVAADVDPIRAAFDSLVRGPTRPERDAGAGSFFSLDTDGMIRATTLEDGLLTVDMEDRRTVLNNASTSCGSESLLAQLNSTAFQFEQVERVRYETDGSCDLFMNWLQRDCVDFAADGSELAVPTNERADGSGCTPGDGPLPDGRWFGYIDQASSTSASYLLGCWFSGGAADAAAAEDGAESPTPNGYHIRIEREFFRELEVAPDTPVSWLPNEGDPASATVIDYERWTTVRFDREIQLGLWVTIEDGVVTAIEEQYQP